MTPKKLQVKSKYNEFDLDEDGIVTDDEIARSKEMVDIELREEKSEAQKMMAWLAILIMVVVTITLFTLSYLMREYLLFQTYLAYSISLCVE